MDDIRMNSCPFCSDELRARAVAGNNAAFAIRDGFPVSPGHTLIIPERHVQDYFYLTADEQQACWSLLNEVKAQLEDEWHPDAWNIGINVGPVAGQTVMHVHIHLIPRYRGDEEDPRGGVRGVIPGKKRY